MKRLLVALIFIVASTQPLVADDDPNTVGVLKELPGVYVVVEHR